jgi:hypothetical protein
MDDSVLGRYLINQPWRKGPEKPRKGQRYVLGYGNGSLHGQDTAFWQDCKV